MTIEILNVDPKGDYIRVTATGEFNLKILRADNGDFAEIKFTLSDADIKALQNAYDAELWHEVESKSYYPDSIEVDGVTVFAERKYFQGETGLYWFRDVKDAQDGRIRCEYATKDDAGNTVWKKCKEASEPGFVSPFEPIAV